MACFLAWRQWAFKDCPIARVKQGGLKSGASMRSCASNVTDVLRLSFLSRTVMASFRKMTMTWFEHCSIRSVNEFKLMRSLIVIVDKNKFQKLIPFAYYSWVENCFFLQFSALKSKLKGQITNFPTRVNFLNICKMSWRIQVGDLLDLFIKTTCIFLKCQLVFRNDLKVKPSQNLCRI